MSSKVLSSDEQEAHEIKAFPYREASESELCTTRELSPDESLAQAERAAYERGYHDGERAAQAAADERLEPTRQRLLGSVEQITALRQHLYRHAEQELVKLAFAIAAKVVKREIRLDRDIVATLVRISLEKVSQTSTARVRLNPEDYRYLAGLQAEGRDEGWGTGVVLAEDVRVEPGGCIVETDAGVADARIEVQLQEIAEQLLSTF